MRPTKQRYAATTTGPPIQVPEVGLPHLRLAFILIIVGFFLGNVVSIYEMENVQTRVEHIVQRALVSVELASQFSRDISQKQLLLEGVVLENEIAEIQRVELQLADTDARIAATSRAYEPTIADEAEHAAWQELQARAAALDARIQNVLGLFMKNQDAQARAAMRTMRPEFEAIHQLTETMTRLNRASADEEVAHITALQRQAIIILSAITVVWALFAFLTARWVTRLIRDRESQIREATLRLEERNRELDAFAGRVAHDLRGPLTTISLAASIISGPTVPAEGPHAAFRRGVSQMEGIIQDLLTLSRAGGQRESSPTCRTEIVAASVRDDLKPKVEAVGGVLLVDAAGATVSCSEGLLRQVLWNLADNAVNYRRSEVQLAVEILGRATPDGYEFTVSDNGSGMSASEARQAFEPFFRGDQARSRPGTGLGLSIVKRVIEASGGSATVDSVPGQGTTFRIRLPLAVAKAA